MYYAAIALTVMANVAYHIFQKSIRPDASPVGSLVITYAVALGCSLFWLLAFGHGRSPSSAVASAGWASYALGVSIVGLELGFLLAYRAGWDLAIAAPYANIAVAVVLLPVGVMAFSDTLTPRKIAGVALAVVAIVLMSARDDGPDPGVSPADDAVPRAEQSPD